MKKIILTLFILFTLAGCNRQEWLGARTSDFWKTVGNNLRPIDDNYNVQIPSLSNCNTIDTDAWGKLVCGTDEVGGGGGSGLWATSSDELLIYPLSNRTVVVGGSATTSDVQFEVTGASKLNSLFIDEDGNVGIGTDEPSEDLEVVGTIYANAIQREGTDDLTIGNTNNGIFHIGGNGADSIMSTISNNLVYKWHRNSPSTYAQIIKFQGEIGSDIQTYFKVGGHPNATDSAYQTPYTHFYTEAYFDDNVGIGTTSPSQKLSVEGNVLADNYYGTWQGSPITDAYVADDITASNYLSLTAWYSTTTDAIVEGSNNLYWTQTRFNSAFSAKTTDDLAEGSTNKYYSTNLFAADLAATTTDALSEGTTNLYYTNGRVDSHLSGGTGITYSSGNISFDCSEVEGTGINCSGESITLDNTGDWTGTLDGYEGTAFVLRNDWTTINDYPTGCSAGEYVQAIGDTLTCASDQDTTYTAGGTLLQLSGTQFSLKEGTLTSGKICKYDSTNGLVCNYDDQNTTYTAGNGLQLSTNEFSIDSPTCSGDDKLQWNGTAFVCDVDNNTTYTAGGTLLQLSGTQFSLKEGTLTDGKLCRYDTTDGLVCDYTDQTGGGGSGSGTVEAGVAGQVAYYETSTSTVSGTSTIFITPEGDVGVGTTSTYNYRLYVNGDERVTGNLQVDGATFFVGNVFPMAGFYGNNASDFRIPNGASPSMSTYSGSIGIDTTNSDQFLYRGNTLNVIVPYREKCFTVASTTFESYDNIPLWSPHQAITVTDIYCRVDGGTSVVVTCGDGTNNMDSITCDTDGQADDGSIANNTFNANERFECDFGTVTGDVNWLNYCITYTIDRD